MTDERPLAGRRVVLGVYLGIVALAGVFGYVIGAIVGGPIEPRLFFLIALPSSPLGMAIYGAVTIAVGLGILLAAVEAVSRYTQAR